MTDTIIQAARIVAAYARNHPVGIDKVPLLIETVRKSLKTAGTSTAPPPAERKPAVPIRHSVTPDYIVCLEDGKKLKMLKRHLRTAYGLTPEGYRTRWNLPDIYPMTAPNYTAHRSTLAKARWFGKTNGRASVPEDR